MSDVDYYNSLINQIRTRSVESTVSMLGITDRNLRNHLVYLLDNKNKKTSFLADPVFEPMFPWEKHSARMKDLSGNLLLPSLVDAMDKKGDHRFGKDWFPFKHQVNAWKTLLDKKQTRSLVVTSGTGSGKTECFMVPVLNDLASEHDTSNEPLIGIRALFIYPLNALINSQRERLRAWTFPFDDALRFCLYNGNTEENKHQDQGKYPNELLTRKNIRSTPPPIMVTNATMLEYMLVRQVDAPILEKSQGKLRWIVLDEAHTYIGSQAAEISLLLKRVLYTFGVEAENVHFIATSATMGDKDADQKAREYLASLAGVSQDQVDIVGGRREIPELISAEKNNDTIEKLRDIEKEQPFSTARYMQLAGNEHAVKLRKSLTRKNRPGTLTELSEDVYGNADQCSQNKLLELLDVASFTVKPGPVEKKPDIDSEAFLPVRLHLFHQVMSGLWGCVDKFCCLKKQSDLKDDWPFGYVYTQRRVRCECGSPVYELVFCIDCNTPHLMAVQTDDGRLIQFDTSNIDEFSLDYEKPEGEQDSFKGSVSDRVFFAPKHKEGKTCPISINPDDLTMQGMGEGALEASLIDDKDHLACSCCDSERQPMPFRQCLLGTPFYISNTVHTLLEACQEGDKANELPYRGKRLITFTDSRQGTARIATKIQQDSERDSIRSQVYYQTIVNQSPAPDNKEKEEKCKLYEEKINKFTGRDQDLVDEYTALRDTCIEEIKQSLIKKPVLWDDMVVKLQASPDISKWIYNYYSDIDPELFNESAGFRTLSEIILLREFARRPKRKNSLETLGLVAITYPALKQIDDIPVEWEKLGFSLEDWKNFIKVALDFYIRENIILDTPKEWPRFISTKMYNKTVLHPQSKENISSSIRRWPQVTGRRSNRLIRLIGAAADIDYTNKYNQDLVNCILRAAWKVLASDIRILEPQSGTLHYHLIRKQLAFEPITEAWLCPVTHRLIDTTFRGLTPYLPFNYENTEITCRKVVVPVCDIDTSGMISEQERKQAIRKWISDNEAVAELRKDNLWTDISDRIVEGGAFYRVAEHSAQQPALRLQKYEQLFKEGKMNILSCSTTMEMGVDIGGITVVAMNNVPPHPANYLQRAGRAGRRGETRAVAFTICKDNPHERSVFTNPLWPFTTSISAPYIILNSAKIVQRHVNSLLMAYFLKNIINVKGNISVINLNCEWFFVEDETGVSVNKEMLRWLEKMIKTRAPEKLERGIDRIVKESVLSSRSFASLCKSTHSSLDKIANNWMHQYLKLKKEIEDLNKESDKDPFKRKVGYDLKRLGQDYLLSELASRTFLPGYGFPAGIATFDHYSVHDFKKKKYVKDEYKGRIDNTSRMRERPGRDISVAIREYAPGADIVLDGLVYKSAGILLNPFSPDTDYNTPQKLSYEWRCHRCGFIGQTRSSLFDSKKCSECGTDLKPANIKEFIEPVGFAVDFYSSPSTDISVQTYIPAEEPWVTANSSLKSLYNPALGSYRNSSEGHIFHYSSGVHGTGYAVCLRCGRTESMTGDKEYPEKLKPEKEHSKLQGKPGAGETAICEGSAEQYSIKPGLHIGASEQTDVFELYLKDLRDSASGNYLSHDTKDPLPWTLAVVLRQALANIHGINADEMGYTVKPSELPGCTSAAGIVLYDRCSGGAGFASAAPFYIERMLSEARSYLNCSDNCQSACQSCLLAHDTRFHVDRLDRKVAIEYLDALSNHIKTPEELKILGDDSTFCVESIDTEIIRYSDQGYDQLFVYLQGGYSSWDIGISGLKGRCIEWLKKFKSVNLVLPGDTIATTIAESGGLIKQDLYFLGSHGARIWFHSGKTGNSIPFVQLSNGIETISLAGVDPDKAIPALFFWQLENSCLVSSRSYPKIAVKELDSSQIQPYLSSDDIEIELTNECDVEVDKFGRKLWDLLIRESDQLKTLVKSGQEIELISYTDDYVSTPWSLMLFGKIIDGLKRKLKMSWTNPLIKLITGNNNFGPEAKGLDAKWSSTKTQKDVFELFFDKMGESVAVDFKCCKEMLERSFEVTWKSGTVTSIRFDHGMSYWCMNGRPGTWFEINDSVKDQVENMFSCAKGISTRQRMHFPTQIVVRHR